MAATIAGIFAIFYFNIAFLKFAGIHSLLVALSTGGLVLVWLVWQLRPRVRKRHMGKHEPGQSTAAARKEPVVQHQNGSIGR